MDDDEQQPPDPADVPVPLLGVDGDPARLLSLARDRHRAETLAERDQFLAAAVWAEMHSEDSVTTADWVIGGDAARPIAGAGCPLIAEFAIPEFAAVIGKSPDAGRRFIGQAVETRHRLPHLWSQVAAGRLEAWKAAKIADSTMALNANAAAFVDAQVAGHAHKTSDTILSRLISEAIARFDPSLAETERQKAADRRCVNIDLGQTGGIGPTGTEATVAIDGILDYADARDLDQAIRQGATELANLGSTESLDVRRSQALGLMARHDLTLDLDGDTAPAESAGHPGREPEPEPETQPGPVRRPAKTTRSRQVIIYAHLSADALGPTIGAGAGLARVEGHGWVTVDQVRGWCGADTQVIVKPVIDTTDCIGVDAYEVPGRLREHVIARDATCVFPGCHRNARRADCDHVQAYADGGPTCSCNLAPLCRPHHRVKTHTAWTYDLLDVGTYLWTTPHGHRLRRDPSGTVLLDPECGCRQPTRPPEPDPPPTADPSPDIGR